MIRRPRSLWASLLAVLLLLLAQQGAWLHALDHLRAPAKRSSAAAAQMHRAAPLEAGHAHASCSLCLAYSVFESGAPSSAGAMPSLMAAPGWEPPRCVERVFWAAAPVYRSRAPPFCAPHAAA